MATDKPVKLYKLLSGSITRYEGAEDKEGARKVVTYEANGDAAGNQVWLTEKEVAAVGLKKLEEVHGAVRNDQGSAGGADQGTDKIAAPPAATSLTGAPAGTPAGEPVEGEEETTTTASSSGNPAVARVLAKKAADGNGK